MQTGPRVATRRRRPGSGRRSSAWACSDIVVVRTLYGASAPWRAGRGIGRHCTPDGNRSLAAPRVCNKFVTIGIRAGGATVAADPAPRATLWRVSVLPPGPTTPAVAQTAHWLLAPLDFMDACARRYGDAFSVHFLGFEQPMVMIADPQAIRALYAQREQLLPPARTLALRPIMGAGSLLLLEGAAHLERRRLMLPPFHGERMRGFEAQMREIAAAEIERWPRRRRARAAAADARDHARGDPAPGLRRDRAQRACSACACCCRDCSTASPRSR